MSHSSNTPRELSALEREFADWLMRNHWSKEAAEAEAIRALAEAAEEDGYDGPQSEIERIAGDPADWNRNNLKWAEAEPSTAPSAPSAAARTFVPAPGAPDDGSNDIEIPQEVMEAVRRVSKKVKDATLLLVAFPDLERDLTDLACIAMSSAQSSARHTGKVMSASDFRLLGHSQQYALYAELARSTTPEAVRVAFDQVNKLAAELASLRSATGLIPEGWKLVPKEPTAEMIRAVDLRPEQKWIVHANWHAMVGAAPTPCSKCGRTPPFPGGTRCQDLHCPLINWSAPSAEATTTPMPATLNEVRDEPEQCAECRSDNIYTVTGVYDSDPSALPMTLKKCAECGHTWAFDE